MKISQITLKNFRGYQEETKIKINDLTAFIGKNDVGKSTVLEALDIFFNEGKGAVKIDKEDINKSNPNEEIMISVIFENFPKKITIDATNETTLENEYLLNRDKKLEVIKRYSGTLKEQVFIKAYHPCGDNCKELLLKKNTELKTIISNNDITTCENHSVNAIMRQAIWEHYPDSLQLGETEIDANKEDAKKIWDKLKNYMPIYTLFQSDRKNSDGDSEIQDPMKLAVQQIIKDENLNSSLNKIADTVSNKLKAVAENTLEKLKEMNPEIADSLNPVIPPTTSLKWADVFKNVTISSDQNIPINKRGSGVKRLILLNFFRAEAERRKNEKDVPSIIYAIEEPETSQHYNHQKKLIAAFKELSQQPDTQIILTTHSSSIVKMMDFQNLNLVDKTDGLKIKEVQKHTLPFPSLNEVNYLAFDELDESYHNELYGFIEIEGWLNCFKQGKPTRQYIRKKKGKKIKEQKILTEYIRDQIHHPENKENDEYTREELRESIRLMREFIISKT